MRVTVEPLSTCKRDLLQRWWRLMGLMVNFMIFIASVRNILDTTRLFPSSFLTNTLYVFIHSPCQPHAPSILISLI
jgi:hypothetical protein